MLKNHAPLIFNKKGEQSIRMLKANVCQGRQIFLKKSVNRNVWVLSSYVEGILRRVL